MKRKYFIQKSLLMGAGLTLLPHISFSNNQIEQKFTFNQLIGKENQDIIGETYTSKMHREAKKAFLKMKTAALEQGIDIEIVSAYRSFQRQKEIFERKYHRFTLQGKTPIQAIEKIIEYSTIPGTSRHHWGTDIDIIDRSASRPNDVLLAKNFHGFGPYCKLKEWMNKHSESFGFYEVYTNNAQRKGFKYEPWHFSYAPVSIPMLKAYKSINLKTVLQQEHVKGSRYFTDAFIASYRKHNIWDINPVLIS